MRHEMRGVPVSEGLLRRAPFSGRCWPTAAQLAIRSEPRGPRAPLGAPGCLLLGRGWQGRGSRVATAPPLVASKLFAVPATLTLRKRRTW